MPTETSMSRQDRITIIAAAILQSDLDVKLIYRSADGQPKWNEWQQTHVSKSATAVVWELARDLDNTISSKLKGIK